MSLSLVGRDRRSAFYVAQAARCGSPVLLLGAGDGVLAHALGTRGVQVVAVEPSPLLLSEAKALTHGLETVTLLPDSLLSLRLSQRFPLVLAPRNSLATATSGADLDAFLATVSHHLGPRGSFVFDLEHLHDDPQVYGNRGRLLFSSHLRQREGGELRRLRRNALSPADLEAAFEAADMDVTERYGDFDGRPYDEGDELQVAVASLR